MAIKRVIAYFMHESERNEALSKLQNSSVTDSYVVGDVDDAEIPALQQQNLIVEEVSPPSTEDEPTANGPGTGVKTLSMGAPSPSAVALDDQIDLQQPQYYRLVLSGPLMQEWKQTLEQAGAHFVEALRGGRYKIRLLPSQAVAVRSHPFVVDLRLILPSSTEVIPSPSSLRPLPPETTLRAGIAGLPGPMQFSNVVPTAPAASATSMETWDVSLNLAVDQPTVQQWLAANNVSIAGSSGRKIRIYVLSNSPVLDNLRALPQVDRLEEYVPPQLHNDVARQLLNIDSANPGVPLGLTGAGQIVGVADTGIDDQHPDLANQIAGKVALGRPGNTTDPAGHGTHVAGSIVGDGHASNGQIRGTAPGAKVYFQSILDAVGGLGGLPLDLGTLFDQAYQAGVRIHNNSWGSSTQSRYTINSSEVDSYIAAKRDLLVVISAGNAGTAAGSLNALPGYVDWLSICSPASCKNALTVGASRSNRTSGGYATMNFSTAWPNLFPQNPIASEMISGNPEAMAAFSSRGPCDDRRIKPDLVAPGTNIASTKSSLALVTNFWGLYASNPAYAFDGGTSMAAPLVSGCAALVREYYIKKVPAASPSASLLKATLINGTRWLNGTDSTALPAGTPNFHQGFGCVDMRMTVPTPANPALQLQYVDLWQALPQLQLSVTGARHRYQLTVPAGTASLNLCLAYTDLPMRALQNNLNLFVQLPDMSKIMGNQQLPNSLNIPDPDNNVEIVRIANPPPGVYLLQIAATNLLKGPQDYALVVTAMLASGTNLSPLVQI